MSSASDAFAWRFRILDDLACALGFGFRGSRWRTAGYAATRARPALLVLYSRRLQGYEEPEYGLTFDEVERLLAVFARHRG